MIVLATLLAENQHEMNSPQGHWRRTGQTADGKNAELSSGRKPGQAIEHSGLVSEWGLVWFACSDCNTPLQFASPMRHLVFSVYVRYTTVVLKRRRCPKTKQRSNQCSTYLVSSKKTLFDSCKISFQIRLRMLAWKTRHAANSKSLSLLEETFALDIPQGNPGGR